MYLTDMVCGSLLVLAVCAGAAEKDGVLDPGAAEKNAALGAAAAAKNAVAGAAASAPKLTEQLDSIPIGGQAALQHMCWRSTRDEFTVQHMSVSVLMYVR